jgi:hypothetical protein
MKFEINFDHMPEYVLIRTDGEASVQDFDNLFTTLFNSPIWVTGTSQIVDHRKLIMSKLTPNDMQRIEDSVKKHKEKLGNGPCAFVVNDALGFGFARMYELIGGENIHHEVKIFYSINKAVEWLKQLKPYNKKR